MSYTSLQFLVQSNREKKKILHQGPLAKITCTKEQSNRKCGTSARFFAHKLLYNNEIIYLCKMIIT